MKEHLPILRAALILIAAPVILCPLYGCPDNSQTTDVSRAFVYVTNNGDNTVTAFAADTTGALTKVKTIATGQAPLGAFMVTTAAAPQRDFVYVANSGDNTISQYEQFADGSLVPLNPPTVPTGQFPVAIDGEAVNINGGFLRVANKGDNTVSEYRWGVNGKLVFDHAITTGSAPVALAHTPVQVSNTLWVLNSGDNTVSEYSPGPANGPTPTSPTASYLAGTGPTGLKYVADATTNQHLLVTSEGDNTILTFPVAVLAPTQSGASAISGPAVSTAAQGRPQAIAGFHAGNVQPSGFYLFTANADGFVGRYLLVDNAASVQPMNPTNVAAGAHPISVAVDHHGSDFVYVANQGDGTVSTYLSATDHSSLTPVGGAVRSGDRSSFVLLGRTPVDQVLANPPGGLIVPIK